MDGPILLAPARTTGGLALIIAYALAYCPLLYLMAVLRWRVCFTRRRLSRPLSALPLLDELAELDGWLDEQLHLAELLTALNARIRVEVGRERQVGHAFFLRDGQPVATEEEFAAAFRGDILPLLREYACDDYDLLVRLLGGSLIDEGEQRLRDLADADGRRLRIRWLDDGHAEVTNVVPCQNLSHTR